jgi:hypothetical protein
MLETVVDDKAPDEVGGLAACVPRPGRHHGIETDIEHDTAEIEQQGVDGGGRWRQIHGNRLQNWQAGNGPLWSDPKYGPAPSVSGLLRLAWWRLSASRRWEILGAVAVKELLAGACRGSGPAKYGEADPEDAENRPRGAEKAYRRSLGNIPEQQKADPWGTVRSDSAPPKAAAKAPPAKPKAKSAEGAAK